MHSDLERMKEKKATRGQAALIEYEIAQLQDEVGKTSILYKDTHENKIKVHSWLENSKQRYMDLCSTIWIEVFKLYNGNLEEISENYTKYLDEFMLVRTAAYENSPIGEIEALTTLTTQCDDLVTKANYLQNQIEEKTKELQTLNTNVN